MATDNVPKDGSSKNGDLVLVWECPFTEAA